MATGSGVRVHGALVLMVTIATQLTGVVVVTSQTLFLCVQVMVDGLPQFCQPESLLRVAPCVDGVGPFWSIDLYGILLTCGTRFLVS